MDASLEAIGRVCQVDGCTDFEAGELHTAGGCTDHPASDPVVLCLVLIS